MFALKLVHRKGWGSFRSPKSYNRSLDCPPPMPRAFQNGGYDFNEPASTPKSNEPTIYLKSAVYPNQCNVEKTTETVYIL